MAEHDPLRTVIACLACLAVEDYLRAQPAPAADSSDERPNPVPLPEIDRAA